MFSKKCKVNREQNGNKVTEEEKRIEVKETSLILIFCASVCIGGIVEGVSALLSVSLFQSDFPPCETFIHLQGNKCMWWEKQSASTCM